MSLSYHYQRSVCDTAMCEPNITNRGKWGKEHCTVDTLLLLLLFWVLVCLFWQSNTAQTDLKFLFLLPLPPKSWGTKLRCIYYSPLTIYESELPHLHFLRNTYHKVTTEHLTQSITPRLIYSLTIMQRK